MHRQQDEKLTVREALKQYGLGLALGTALAVYGLVALVMRRAFLPGYRSAELMVTGRHGVVLALAYLLGGLYVITRLYVEPRLGDRPGRTKLVNVQIGLLLALVAAMIAVLLRTKTLDGV